MSQAKRPWVQGRNEFAAALWHTEGVWLRALLVVPVPVLMVLLAPLVCDSTNRAENTSLLTYGSVQIYTSDTNHHEQATNEPRRNETII
jgi:hypothetical protein